MKIWKYRNKVSQSRQEIVTHNVTHVNLNRAGENQLSKLKQIIK